MEEINKNTIDFLGDGKSFVSLVDKMVEDPLLKTVNAARISYNKKSQELTEKDKNLLEFLWENGHTSPFRHSYFTFHMKLPIFVARQLMKYQVGSGFRTYEVNQEEVSLGVFDHFYDIDKGCSWNEISGRYTTPSEDYYLPKELRSNPSHGNKQSSGEYKNPLNSNDEDFEDPKSLLYDMDTICVLALNKYRMLIKNGVAKEIARMILPQNMYTECYWTVSLQAINHFLTQRLDKNAQHEIRCLALAVQSIIKQVS
jgi:thymidylate synthase (FAD)